MTSGLLGSPAVLFNAHAGDLWRRFTTYLPRHLARPLRQPCPAVPEAHKEPPW